MKLKIDNNSTIKKLQDEFNKSFPYLKLEFFSKPHHKGEGSRKRDMLDTRKKLADFRKQTNSSDLFIDKNMTVAELENLLSRNYGLFAQVFRKSGKLWLETTATDNWTLETQNEQGRELQNAHLGTPPEETDYHEQE